MNRTESQRVFELVTELFERLEQMQTISVRTKKSQMRLVNMFMEVSEIVIGTTLPAEDAKRIADQYIKIAGEHELSADAFQQMSEIIIQFLGYMNILYGYAAAGKDQNESIDLGSTWKRGRLSSGFTRQQKHRVRHRVKQGRRLERDQEPNQRNL